MLFKLKSKYMVVVGVFSSTSLDGWRLRRHCHNTYTTAYDSDMVEDKRRFSPRYKTEQRPPQRQNKEASSSMDGVSIFQFTFFCCVHKESVVPWRYFLRLKLLCQVARVNL